ncbi:hypothetical protein [Gudongella sp. SC589]|uniref:hypothetical protein n=1 Tax=Gudongella sp. SC589 TaxID=3385990 RepID=UPI00390473C8
MTDVTYSNSTTIMDILIKFDNGTYNPERYIKYINDLYETRTQIFISEDSVSDHFMLWGSQVVIDKDKEINRLLTDYIFVTVVDFFHGKDIYKVGEITEESLVELMFATNVGMKKFLPLLYILFTGENPLDFENRSKEEQDEISRKIVAFEIMEIETNDEESIENELETMNYDLDHEETESDEIKKDHDEEVLVDKNSNLAEGITEEHELVLPPNSDEALKSYGEFRDIIDKMSSYILDSYSQSISEVEKLKSLNSDLSEEISESHEEYRIKTEEYLSEIDTLRDIIHEKDLLITDLREKIKSITVELEEHKRDYDLEVKSQKDEIDNLKRTIEDFSSIKGMVDNILKRFK